MLHFHIQIDPAQHFDAAREYIAEAPPEQTIQMHVEVMNYGTHWVECVSVDLRLLGELADHLGSAMVPSVNIAPESVRQFDIRIPAPTKEVYLVKAVVSFGPVDLSQP